MKGKVVKYFSERKYGFIRGEDNQRYFVHASAVCLPQSESLIAGESVAFDCIQKEKGWEAIHVCRD